MASVLHLLAPNLPTGTVGQIRYLVNGTKAAGWSANVCSYEPQQSRKQRIQKQLPQTQWCQHSLRLDPTIIIRCARHLRSTKPDIVHCWGQHQMPFLSLALRLAGTKDVLWSVRSQAELDSHTQSITARTIVTNADYLAQSLPAQHRIYTIPNAVAYRSSSATVLPLFQTLGVSPDSIFIGVMGDLRAKKRLKDVVWAFDLLRVIRSDLHLVILGEGESLVDLKPFVEPLVSSAAVHMLGFRSNVQQILRQCSCFWQASEDEGCSNALLEAMAEGLPVVVSDIPGHREIIEKVLQADSRGATVDSWGALTTPGDCAEMARRTNLLLDAQQNEKASDGDVRSHVFDEYSTEKMVGRYNALYQSLLSTQKVAA